MGKEMSVAPMKVQLVGGNLLITLQALGVSVIGDTSTLYLPITAKMSRKGDSQVKTELSSLKARERESLP